MEYCDLDKGNDFKLDRLGTALRRFDNAAAAE